MNITEKKLSKNRGTILAMLCFMLLGAFCGVIITLHMDSILGENRSLGRGLLVLAAAIVLMYIVIFLHIILHETGHLLAGLCSGYTFSSFRIGNLMWVKESNKIKLCRLSLAGTGGQCLMNPPDMIDGKLPFIFYNLGGALMNLLTIPLCAVLLVFSGKIPILSLFLQMMCIVGLGYALINGIPMKLGTVNNDGCNAKDLGKSPEALQSFWIQMKVMEQTTKGVRLKDMPDEWFYLPDENGLKNSMTAVMAVFYENRLMDTHAFADAEALIDKLLTLESGIVGLHRNLLVCDRLYCELIKPGDKNSERIDGLHSKEQVKFMKQMRNFPTVLRTDYAYTLLYCKEVNKAAQIKLQFEKCGKTHPYAADIESEQELIEIADKSA